MLAGDSQLPLSTGADQVVIEKEQSAEQLTGRGIPFLRYRLPQVTEGGAEISPRKRSLRRPDWRSMIHRHEPTATSGYKHGP